ncbi:uroporphyrinogen decarboxylase family protein [Candidatus Poribacteria bacterium]
MINFAERINAVLHHQKPDRVPFAPSDNLIPRGDFEREMRNKGMGLYAERPLYWSETPNVNTEAKRQAGSSLTVYHTPIGNASTGTEEGKSRYMIESADDYEAVIFMVNDTVFHADYSVYSNVVRDLGTDGIVRGTGIKSPLEDIVRYVGTANLEKEQRAHPEQFAALLEALEQKAEELLTIVSNSPAELVSVGRIDGFQTPEQFEEYCLPFYQKYLPHLHEKGKICALDVHTSKARAFSDMIAQTGIDVAMGFMPPPVGDLPLQDALSAWGGDITIWLDFPETILLNSAEETKEYAINLLKSIPPDNLIIGLTGVKPATDEGTEHALKMGLKTILDVASVALSPLANT